MPFPFPELHNIGGRYFWQHFFLQRNAISIRISVSAPCCTKYCICWTHGGACSAETETDHLHKVDCRYAVAVCSGAEHRMKVSSYSSLKVAAAGRMLHAAAAHKATLHLQPAVLCSRQQPLIKTFGSYPIKFPSSLRVEKVLSPIATCCPVHTKRYYTLH